MSRRSYPPDYVSRETLAYRLDLRAADIDRMVTAGMLPQPVLVGNEKRWRWTDVEARLVSNPVDVAGSDPYMQGVKHAGPAATVRQTRPV